MKTIHSIPIPDPDPNLHPEYVGMGGMTFPVKKVHDDGTMELEGEYRVGAVVVDPSFCFRMSV